jgi:hypothetical protein
MFGQMSVDPILRLHNGPGKPAPDLESAMARLLVATEQPKVVRWIQFPAAVLVFLVVPGDSESGAFYVYDREVGLGSGWTSMTTNSEATTKLTSRDLSKNPISSDWSKSRGFSNVMASGLCGRVIASGTGSVALEEGELMRPHLAAGLAVTQFSRP